MRRFERGLRGGESAEFLDWMSQHPEEFFINLVSPRAGRLHRADCPHMKFRAPETVDFVSRPKMTDCNRAALETWARERGVALRPCPDCRV